jgi:hypothetical protein
MPDVLLAMMQLLPTSPSISLNTAALMSSFSGTVSMTTVAPARHSFMLPAILTGALARSGTPSAVSTLVASSMPSGAFLR